MIHIELTKPSCGWSNMIFRDGDNIIFNGLLSYIQDVPGLIIGAAIEYRKSKITDVFPSIRFDEEGQNYIIAPNEYETYIIVDRKAKPELLVIDIAGNELFNQLIQQIEKHFDEWAMFDSYGDETENEIQNIKKQLRTLIDEYKSIC